MDLKGKRIILASGSPRRRELLAAMGVEFTVDTQNTFEERYDPGTPHEQVPVLMAEGKSNGFHRALEPDEILITADTMVLCHAQGAASPILGKPHGREDAISMLRLLSGNDHEVITAVTVRDKDRCITRCASTTVSFKELTDNETEYYVDNFKPFDKAGAYGIQEWIGYIGITEIKGSYFNVVGFPTHLVYEMLQAFI
ncbi:MAG: Maf family nucleotide pyrophosphatase [Bacteroidia bacterium]|nr:Maf family nucleotide pyrophosphatase [Bacteroidia bacterium]